MKGRLKQDRSGNGSNSCENKKLPNEIVKNYQSNVQLSQAEMEARIEKKSRKKFHQIFKLLK